MMEAGRFRRDLFYRLGAFVIAIPPLRERPEDIPALALHFLDLLTERHGRPAKGLTPEATSELEHYDWPGNARQLMHTLERLLLLAPDDARIDAALVHQVLSEGRRDRAPRTLAQTLEGYERTVIEAELARCHGVVAQAAAALGVDRTTLSKRCKRLGIRKPRRPT